MLCSYQLKIDDVYNIPISNVKKLVSNVFDKETYVVRYENFQLYLQLGLKIEKHIVYQNLINYNGSNHLLNLTHKKE